jgi:hypothetical protein
MARSNTSEGTSNRATTTASKTPFPKGLDQPALRALASAGYDHLEQLASVPEASLLCLHGFGPMPTPFENRLSWTASVSGQGFMMICRSRFRWNRR